MFKKNLKWQPNHTRGRIGVGLSLPEPTYLNLCQNRPDLPTPTLPVVRALVRRKILVIFSYLSGTQSWSV